MPLDADARGLLDLLDELGVPPMESLTPEGTRAAYAALASPPSEVAHEIRDVDAGGVPARLYRPDTGARVPGLLVWYHGGGWVLGSLDLHDGTCSSLARRSGHAVLSIDYRLAPEHPFPAALTDCVTATSWAHENADALGIDPTRIAVGGDSAGGNLAAVVAQLAPIPIVSQLLVYPVTDARAGSASYVENADGYLLTAASMHWFIGHYLSGDEGSPDDPRVSPLLAADEAIAKSPPTLVITAGFDPLRDEGTDFAARLAGTGVRVSHVHFPDQIHAFFSQLELIADARTAHAICGHALAEALGEDDDPPAAG